MPTGTWATFRCNRTVWVCQPAGLSSFDGFGPSRRLCIASAPGDAQDAWPAAFRLINKVRRAGYVASFDNTWKSLDSFVDMYHETMHRVQAADWYFFSCDYFSEMRTKLRHHLHLCTVKHNDSIVCGGLFSEYDGIVHYLFGAVHSAHLASHGSKLMIDHARRWAKQRGNRLLHLGGGVGGRNDSLLQFKSGFAKSTSSYATIRLVTNPVAYRALVLHWEKTTQAAADGTHEFFPAYRKSANTALASSLERRAA